MKSAMIPQRVTNIKHVRDYLLNIRFADGAEFTFDFWPMIQAATDPLHAPLRDLATFRQVAVNGLTIEWPTGLDVCPDGLRRWCEAGRILPEESIHTVNSESLR
jgi:hypothetical protein